MSLGDLSQGKSVVVAKGQAAGWENESDTHMNVIILHEGEQVEKHPSPQRFLDFDADDDEVDVDVSSTTAVLKLNNG